MAYNFDPKIVDNIDVDVALTASISVSLSEYYGTADTAKYRYENKFDYMPNVNNRIFIENASQCKKICERNLS